MTDNRLTLAIQALRYEYEVQTQGILDDDLSDTSISVDCGDLFIALEALDALAELYGALKEASRHFTPDQAIYHRMAEALSKAPVQ